MSAENFGVPAECEDVMMQAFYWDSYKTQTSSDSKYGRTKWVDLLKDTAAINASFDLVWFPPSASSSGGVGYIPACMSNQDNTDWGSLTKLKQLIAALHAGGTKVLADIVINHRGNKSSWVDFWEDNFGTYGKYQLKQEHICAGDEAFTSSDSPYKGSSTHGAADSGTDFDGARDLDHRNEYVREWAKAYLQWMLDVMQYDGFRYDMTLGYSGAYLSEYNVASEPYLSVSEYWESIDKQVNHLQATNYNTMIFDFPLKYVLQNALGKYSRYYVLKNPNNSLRNKGYKRYAVTFIDNHDTFERSDNQGGEFISYKANLATADVKKRIMEANAYILMMPGVPCVFYPHWKSYQNDIDALIAVRKAAGLHSESEIEETSDRSANLYEAVITGHRRTVILRMGPDRSKEVPAGYHLALEGGDMADYTIFMSGAGMDIETVNSVPEKGEKFMQDGKLFIRLSDKVYDAQGLLVK